MHLGRLRCSTIAEHCWAIAALWLPLMTIRHHFAGAWIASAHHRSIVFPSCPERRAYPSPLGEDSYSFDAPVRQMLGKPYRERAMHRRQSVFFESEVRLACAPQSVRARGTCADPMSVRIGCHSAFWGDSPTGATHSSRVCERYSQFTLRLQLPTSSCTKEAPCTISCALTVLG